MIAPLVFGMYASLELGGLFYGANFEANRSMELEKLIATEEAGAETGRKISAITPRTNQAMQPALGQMRVGRVRVVEIG